MLPRLRITDLLAEVHGWTGFSERFLHLRSGAPPEDILALMTALLADATNLGLARMARSSTVSTHSKLLWTAEWHVRDETYQAALACLVDAIHAHPFTKVWGDGDTSSSDGQFFRAGGHGEARADHNAKYGSEPGVKFYTHVSDRYAPFNTKVIAANASEAAHVLDGLLHHESALDIREHYTDTAGAIDHVFGLCRLLGFRFAPRIRDLADRRLYVLDTRAEYKALTPIIGGAVDIRVVGDNWDEILRSGASIKAGTVAPSALMRRLAAYPRQNAIAKTLREIGRLERTLFTLDWISDPACAGANAGLNKGEAHHALKRAVFFHRLGEIRDRTFENRKLPRLRPQSRGRRHHSLEHRVSGTRRRRAAFPRRNYPRRARRPHRPARLGAHRVQRRLRLAGRTPRNRLQTPEKSKGHPTRRRLAYDSGKILR